ncbi:hypothetical protein [Microbacterium enclense]|uniref:hypothetical protein n=1 Tax=Microbacterium enclense TaxID=993073 RepID=UPI003F8047B2
MSDLLQHQPDLEELRASSVAEDAFLARRGLRHKHHASASQGFREGWKAAEKGVDRDVEVGHRWVRRYERYGVTWRDGFAAGWDARLSFAAERIA